MRVVPMWRVSVGPPWVILWAVLTVGLPRGADVTWTAGVPLWTSLSPAGNVMDAGPLAGWVSPPMAARLGTPQFASEPRDLSEVRADPTGQALPPAPPVS